MRKCNCRNCGREFTVAKPMPFCSGQCRVAHTYQQTINEAQSKTIQAGVEYDNSNTEKE